MVSPVRKLRPEQWLFLGFLAIGIVLLVADYFRTPAQGFVGYRQLTSGLLVLLVLLTVWTLMGGLRGPAAVFLTLAFLAFTYVATVLNGVHSVTVTMFILLIVIAVPLLGWGPALVATVASLAVVWVLAFLPIPIALPTSFIQARNLSLVFVGVFLLVWWYSRLLRAGAESLRQSNLELEARVAERTQQVLVSEKLATVGRLSAGLAHDLNTPLGAVSSAQASAEAALRIGLLAAFRSLSSMEADHRRLLEGLLERVLHSGQSTTLLSSFESRERRKLLVSWGRGELDDEASLALADGLVGIPGLTREEFLALGREPRWATSLGLIEAVSTLVRSLEVIGRGARKMDHVVRSVQALSHNEVLETAPTVVDPRDEMEGALLLLESQIPPAVELVRHYEEVRLLCRPHRLSRVLVNLLTNALHAMDHHGPLELTIRPEGEWGVIEVADSGKGVPPGWEERIFEPFVTTKAPGEGNGLGLDLARRTCQEEGGTLRLEQRPGRTIFVVRLPRAEA